MYESTCKSCGASFIVWSPTENCKDCNKRLRRSARHRKDKARRRRLADRPEPVLTERSCTSCGELFTHNQWSVSEQCPTCNAKDKNRSTSIRASYRRKLARQAEYDRKVAIVKAALHGDVPPPLVSEEQLRQDVKQMRIALGLPVTDPDS